MTNTTRQQIKPSAPKLSDEMQRKLKALPPERREQVIAAASKTLARIARKRQQERIK